MSRFSDACSRPFSNGTEGEAWMSRWCNRCVRDHAIHDESYESDGMCQIILAAAVDDRPWPEAWLPEPDDGEFHLPSRMICAQFSPCTKGACEGDPFPEGRAQVVAETTAYWRSVTTSGDPS